MPSRPTSPRRPSLPLPLLRACALATVFMLAGACAPAAASAHGVSGLTSLPVPAWLFAWAAAVVLVVSFVLLSTLWPAPAPAGRARARAPPVRVAGGARRARGAIGLALFALVIYAGYEGAADYTGNLDPTFIFVIFWVGVPVSSALLGDWFRAFSPWLAFARGVRWLGCSARPALARAARLPRAGWAAGRSSPGCSPSAGSSSSTTTTTTPSRSRRSRSRTSR